MSNFYTTIENQKRSDGTYGLLYDHFYEEENQAPAYDRALAKFFTICAAAAVSDIPYHEAVLLSSNSGFMRREVWDRRENTSANEEEI
jgi:hypothetical protein